jgi:hypothetical protein
MFPFRVVASQNTIYRSLESKSIELEDRLKLLLTCEAVAQAFGNVHG